jgi:hypothetical protein
MRNLCLTIALLVASPLATGCAGNQGESDASVLQFNEPTFVSVQPIAYPHPTGCEMCGFPDRLGTPQQ